MCSKPWSRRPPPQSGQATLEYAVVLGVVAAVLVAAGAVFSGPAIANAVGLGVRRALCVVGGGGPCLVAEEHPCVVRSTSTGGKVTVKLAFVRLGRGMGLLRAERSDGTVELTLLDDLQAGVEAGLGAEGHLRLGHVELQEGGLAQLEAIARLGGGRSWATADARAADRLQRRLIEVLAGRGASALPWVGSGLKLAQQLLGRGQGRELPAPDAVVRGAGVRLKATGQAGPFALDASVGVDGGVREDRRSGRRTYVLRVHGEGSAALASELGHAGAAREATLGYTVAPDGTPLELSVSTQVDTAGHLALPVRAGHRTSGGWAEQLQLTAALDLTDPGDLAAARRLLHGSTGPVVAAIAEVGRRMAEHGRVDMQRYAVDETGYGGGAEVAAGAKAGLDVALSRSALRLRDAWSRPAGGVWERRLDCLGG